MVNNSAQLYTIEGVAAGVLMIVTAYLIVSTSTVLTPQDIHISDMQLEQLGHDALLVLNTPQERETRSILYTCIRDDIDFSDDSNVDFNSNFIQLLNSRVYAGDDTIHFKVQLFYTSDGGQIQPPIDFTSDGVEYFRENAVKVTQWVKMEDPTNNPNLQNKIILVEALVWRG